jgi:hypothetical protein
MEIGPFVFARVPGRNVVNSDLTIEAVGGRLLD